jgi:phosphotriesterase-related protein
MGSGVVRTVLGDVAADDLGITLCHEHLLITWGRWRTEAGLPITLTAPDDPRAYQPITLETVGWIRRWGSRLLENIGLEDESASIDELHHFTSFGGSSIVDATNPDLGRNPAALARISRAAGVNVIMGSGHYVDVYHPLDMDRRTQEDLTQEIIDDVTVGCDGTSFRAGIIGEIGCSSPLTTNERKALIACARAQRLTGAPLLIHPGRDNRSPFEILAVIVDAGGDVRRVIMSHLDRTLFSLSEMLDLGATGCYLQFDLFGRETFPYRHAEHVFLPTDATRVDYLLGLIDAGCVDQLLVSHDICAKTRLIKYGGEGYAHILENVLPIMRRKGMAQATIDRILIGNPRRALQLANLPGPGVSDANLTSSTARGQD